MSNIERNNNPNSSSAAGAYTLLPAVQSIVHNEDCTIGMKRFSDNQFDLAIVDPPYGIGENWKKDRHSKFYKHKTSYKNNNIPGQEYFQELFRVSKNQIIWGGNYYTDYLPPRNSWIVWDKDKDFDKQNMAEGELAWTSFSVPLRIVKLIWNGCVVCEPRAGFHPHEKPVKLYDWVIKKYAKDCKSILDTHVGSGSSRIAAYKNRIDFVGFEIDKYYYDEQQKRFNNFRSQLTLF